MGSENARDIEGHIETSIDRDTHREVQNDIKHNEGLRGGMECRKISNTLRDCEGGMEYPNTTEGWREEGWIIQTQQKDGEF